MESGVSLLYHTFSAPALDIGFGFSSLLVLVFFFSTPDGSRQPFVGYRMMCVLAFFCLRDFLWEDSHGIVGSFCLEYVCLRGSLYYLGRLESTPSCGAFACSLYI